MTTGQVLVIGVVLIGVGVVLKIAKKAGGIIFILLAVAIGCMNYDAFIPKEVVTYTQQAAQAAKEVYDEYGSDYIKRTKNGDIAVRLGKESDWVLVKDIAEIQTGGKSLKVTVNGKTYEVTDKTVSQFLERIGVES